MLTIVDHLDRQARMLGVSDVLGSYALQKHEDGHAPGLMHPGGHSEDHWRKDNHPSDASTSSGSSA